MNWKKTVTTVVISTSLMTTSFTAIAAPSADMNAESAAAVSYPLNDTLSVELKTVLNEHVLGGTRLGVVVRMNNNGAAVARVPEYEVRMKTNDGVEYTLQASAANPKSIQPKAKTELSYLAVVDRTDTVTLAEVNWTDVDYYVYPKKETLMVAVPISDQAWKGADAPITNPAMIKKWGETFTIPSLLSPLQFQPLSIDKEVTEKGTVQVVQLLVTNPTGQRETLPEFLIDGKSDSQVYAGEKIAQGAAASAVPPAAGEAAGGTAAAGSADTSGAAPAAANAAAAAVGATGLKKADSQSYSGQKMEQGEIILEPKEKKYVHYAIATDNDTALSSLTVLTPEKFAQAGGQQTSYLVGRLKVLLPDSTARTAASSYQIGQTMKFDALSDLIHPNLDVSIVEFHMNDNEDEGSKSVTAKFKLFNKTDQPMAVPVFQTDLVSSDGYTYTGSRQNIAAQRILPNSGVVINYAYTLPASETGSGLIIRVNDTQKAAPYKTTIASYGIGLQQPDTNESFDVYPFEAKVGYWTITPMFNRRGDMTYSYKVRFDLELKRAEQVQLDPSFSKLQFEIYNSTNNLIGATPVSFTGANRLVSGENNIMLNATSEQLERPLTVKLYEVFQTPAGESKRLIGVYTQ
ncbi:hypothetical protein E1757_16125 [Paenibacillus piri]|uniref:DUF4139 domain-containing protein n=2 Tax=Paenibacillus piri TaxID=2547395 RepID=A0A4R5KMH3_9BACL|nr:hypothetical protein E1757_16125 [Paenibacillus piri]